jgi:hypothetical protein
MSRQIDHDLNGAPTITGTTLSVPELSQTDTTNLVTQATLATYNFVTQENLNTQNFVTQENLTTQNFVTQNALDAQDFAMYSLDFDQDIPVIKMIWPVGYPYARVVLNEPEEAGASLLVQGRYVSTSAYTITTTKTAFTELEGMTVIFIANIANGTEADFQVMFTRS